MLPARATLAAGENCTLTATGLQAESLIATESTTFERRPPLSPCLSPPTVPPHLSLLPLGVRSHLQLHLQPTTHPQCARQPDGSVHGKPNSYGPYNGMNVSISMELLDDGRNSWRRLCDIPEACTALRASSITISSDPSHTAHLHRRVSGTNSGAMAGMTLARAMMIPSARVRGSLGLGPTAGWVAPIRAPVARAATHRRRTNPKTSGCVPALPEAHAGYGGWVGGGARLQ